jgi:hypothetical protein
MTHDLRRRIVASATAVLVLPLALGLTVPAPARADTSFPQTGQTLWGPFETYWLAHGGLAKFGMPRTSVYAAGNAFDAQWLERAMFTYTPSNPDPFKVELQLLGSMITEGRRGEAPFMRAANAGEGLYFPETGHNLAGKFREYWESTGGLPIYGFPISEQFRETSKSDGKSYLVQYFERNRFEYHPEQAGTAFEVQLGLLGSELLDRQGGPAAVASKPKAAHYPAPAAGGIATPGGGLADSPNAGTPVPGGQPSVPPAPALPSANSPVIYQSDFSAPGLTSWSQVRGPLDAPDLVPARWSVANGVLVQTGRYDEEDAARDALIVTNDTLTDARLDVYTFATSGQPVGVVLRLSEGGYYLLRLFVTAGDTQPKAVLYLVTPQGEVQVGASRTWAGYTPATWNLVTATAKGTSITIQINGQDAITANDDTVSSGKFGLYAFADGSAKFDNFRLTRP